jgi:hypothetical protein
MVFFVFVFCVAPRERPCQWQPCFILVSHCIVLVETPGLTRTLAYSFFIVDVAAENVVIALWGSGASRYRDNLEDQHHLQ